MSFMLAHVRLLLLVFDPCAIQKLFLLDCPVPDASIPDPLRQNNFHATFDSILQNFDVGVLSIFAVFQN